MAHEPRVASPAHTQLVPDDRPKFVVGIGPVGSADDLRLLRAAMLDVDGFRGNVQLIETPPAPGTLGPVLDGLLVSLGPGGAITALAGVVIVWLRHRRSDVDLTVTRPDGVQIHVSAQDVRGVDAGQLQKAIEEMAQALDRGAADTAEPGTANSTPAKSDVDPAGQGSSNPDTSDSDTGQRETS